MELTKIFNYDGECVTFKNENGTIMVNATQMAKPFNKRPTDWLRLPSAKEFLWQLSEVRKVHSVESELVITISGGLNGGGCTWMQEDVAIEFARWISPKFSIWCNDRIKELINTGTTSISQFNTPTTYIEALEALVVAEKEKEKIKLENIKMENELVEQAPKVEYYEKVLTSDARLTVTEMAKELGMSAKKLNRILQDLRVQYKSRKNDGWCLYSPYDAMGYVKYETRPVNKNDYRDSRSSMYWTEAGKEFVYKMLKKNKYI